MKNTKIPSRRFHEEIIRKEYFFSMNSSQKNHVCIVVNQNTFVLNSGPMMQKFAKYQKELVLVMTAVKKCFI